MNGSLYPYIHGSQRLDTRALHTQNKIICMCGKILKVYVRKAENVKINRKTRVFNKIRLF